MSIYVHDTRDKPGKHKNVEDYLTSHGHKIVKSKMFVGDVTLLHDQTVCIDLKRNMLELVSNICQGHKRFSAELERAMENGIQLIVLVEEGGIAALADVANWKNPRRAKSPLAPDGNRCFNILLQMQEKYKVKFLFCDKRDTGRQIVEILEGRYDTQ